MKATNILWDTDEIEIDLPQEIDIPMGLIDEEEITDYLSESTGFCVIEYYLENNRKEIN